MGIRAIRDIQDRKIGAPVEDSPARKGVLPRKGVSRSEFGVGRGNRVAVSVPRCLCCRTRQIARKSRGVDVLPNRTARTERIGVCCPRKQCIALESPRDRNRTAEGFCARNRLGYSRLNK